MICVDADVVSLIIGCYFGTVFCKPMLIVAVTGFYFAFQIFDESGKTFAMYIQRYAGYAFGVFLFPIIGFLITMVCSINKT